MKAEVDIFITGLGIQKKKVLFISRFAQKVI